MLVAPMFVYLEFHPEAQTRLQMLDSTLGRALEGELAPLMRNVTGALLAFVWPGQGDRFLAYNIPGRPVLDALSALFFVAGLLVALWRWRKPAYAFLLLWFVAGIIPSLLTGATANTTRNAAAMPATYLLAATGFVALSERVRQQRESLTAVVGAAAVVWVVITGVLTADAYFRRWGQGPDVRAAYQHTLVAQVEYLKEEASEEAVISSVYPGAAHDPGIGLVLAGERPDWRWVDARTAVVFPEGGPALLAAPSSTPLHPFFTPWSHRVDTVELRPDDLDPYFTVLQITPPSWPAEVAAAFGGERPALALLQAGWREAGVRAGEVAEMVLVWRVIQPAGVGPVQAGIDATDVVFFTHVMTEEGTVLAQQDAITAPSWDWRAGDIVVQIHQIAIPAESAPGTYETRVGVYDRQSEQRLPRFGASAEVPIDTAIVESLRIIP
jgi:hypothetical protein